MLIRSFELNDTEILAWAIAPDTQTIAITDVFHSKATVRRIQFWDISQDSFSFVSELENTHGEVTKIAFSADSKTAAASNERGYNYVFV